MHPARLVVTAAVLLAIAACGTGSARADAALAVGQPADVAGQGIALGWAVDYASKAAAEKEALARCRGFEEAPQATRDKCRIVESFTDRCLAVALDPERGTTGVGWGVNGSQKRATKAAMKKCQEASTRKRRGSCRVALTRCDGR